MLTADELVCERCGISPVLCGCRPCGPSPRAVPTSWMGRLRKRPLDRERYRSIMREKVKLLGETPMGKEFLRCAGITGVTDPWVAAANLSALVNREAARVEQEEVDGMYPSQPEDGPEKRT